MEGKDTKRNSETMQETMMRILADPEKASKLAELLAELAESGEAENTPKAIPQKEEPEKEKDMEIVVTDFMHYMGIPAHIKGYQYIRTAIMMAIQDMNILNYITKQLYPEIAQQYETTGSRVERAIRHAIEVAWQRGSYEAQEEVFGYTVKTHSNKPTNSEFIAMVADRIRLEMK